MTRIIAALIFSLLACSAASAQGCGPSNPNCIVADRPAGDSTGAAANTKFVTSAIAAATTAISIACPAHQFVNVISGSGSTCAQPAFTDISGTLGASQFGPLTGDVTTSGYAATLANTAVTLGSYGDATHVATFTVDQKGRLTAAGTATITASSPTTPQGRLTLTSGTSVMIADVAAATTVFYTPAIGLFVPLWNGSTLTMTSIGAELSQTTADTTKSPAAVANNSNYDVFVWSDSGTMRATRGPAWTSDTARGTGAGTTELDFTTAPGVPLNKNAITNGPAADRGTYVGTIRSNGTATIDVKFGTAAAGGGAAVFGVWNAYNRANASALVQDSTASYTYTSITIRPANNSTTFRVSYVSGLAVDAAVVSRGAYMITAAVSGALGGSCWALDVTNADTGGKCIVGNTVAAVAQTIISTAAGTVPPQLGFHFIQAVENGDGTNATTFNGNQPYLGLNFMLPM